MLFATRLNEIANQVAQYQAEIARLQQLISDQQQHSQQLQSAEQAAESAIAQVETALMMINAIAPDQIEIFKSAIDAKFSKDAIAELPPAVDEVVEPDVEELEPESDGIENDSDDSEATTTVDVEVIPEVELEVGEMPEVTSNGNRHREISEDEFLSYDELVKVSRASLIKLAKGHVAKPQHKSVADLAQVLADKGITQEDVDNLN